MKKSILSFGGIMILFLIVCSCSEEQENPKLPEDPVNLKVAITKEKQKADERGTYNVSHLLTYLHSYINIEVSEEYTYYENMPERKEVDWFFENFKNNFQSGSETDDWTLEKIKSGEIYIFGTNVKEIKVVALIFSESLILPEEFTDKRGIFLDNDKPDCPHEIYTAFGKRGSGANCHCVMVLSCYNFGRCQECNKDAKPISLKDLFNFDPLIINDFDFEKFGSVSVSKINYGDPVLELKIK